MRIEWTLLAVMDREDIFEYIQADSMQAAIAVDDRIEMQVDLLRETAAIGRPGRVAGTRELVIGRTPYIAAYLIERDRVLILRVLHGAQIWPASLAR